MIRAFRLSTVNGLSHVERGSVATHNVVDVQSIMFQETPAHSSLEWHDAPTTQYVITLAGVLEFTNHNGETFTLVPGNVLIALDTTGSGHKWRLLDDEPWKRAYVVFKDGTDPLFVPDPA